MIRMHHGEVTRGETARWACIFILAFLLSLPGYDQPPPTQQLMSKGPCWSRSKLPRRRPFWWRSPSRSMSNSWTLVSALSWF